MSGQRIKKTEWENRQAIREATADPGKVRARHRGHRGVIPFFLPATDAGDALPFFRHAIAARKASGRPSPPPAAASRRHFAVRRVAGRLYCHLRVSPALAVRPDKGSTPKPQINEGIFSLPYPLGRSSLENIKAMNHRIGKSRSINHRHFVLFCLTGTQRFPRQAWSK